MQIRGKQVPNDNSQVISTHLIVCNFPIGVVRYTINEFSSHSTPTNYLFKFASVKSRLSQLGIVYEESLRVNNSIIISYKQCGGDHFNAWYRK